MNIMPWIAHARPAPSAKAQLEPTGGRLTGVALDDVRRLRLPPLPDPLGYTRPPLDATALKLSLELAYMTYTFDLEPWMHAGWKDFSIQVDNRLESGVTVSQSENAASEHIRELMNVWKVTRARLALKEFNPVAQIMGAFRQREKSDTIKAVTMLHPAGEGRYVVAIGFMGTGSRFYDWFSNFRFTTQDGFHKGFYQLTEYFEQSAGRIMFPDTAAELGLSALTLQDVLMEMQKPDSRFSLWMAGHSQGSAVMQVFCYRLIHTLGVLPRHMVGYGFASPTTSVGMSGRDPAKYPLYHIINTDDLVPRIGALQHLGLCLQYDADSALREAAYGWTDDPADKAMREMAEQMFAHITDTPTMLETLAAISGTVMQEKTEENLATLMDKHWRVGALDKALAYAGSKTMETLQRASRYARVAYRSLMGRRMDEAVVTRLCEEMRPTVRDMPLRKLLSALSNRFYPPHVLCRAHCATGSYGYIVLHGSQKLRPFVWVDSPDSPPYKLFAPGNAMFTPLGNGAATKGLTPHRRHTPPHAPTRRSARTRGIGATHAIKPPSAYVRPKHREAARKRMVNKPLLNLALWRRKPFTR